MKVKLTLERQAGPSTDIVVTADAFATVSDVASAIRRSDPYAPVDAAPPQASTLRIGSGPTGRSIDADVLLADSALWPGASVAIADNGPQAASVAPAASTASLRVAAGPDAGLVVPLRDGSSFIGRDAAADVHLKDPLVSKRHARIDISVGSARIVDLNSANGIEIDGSPVTRAELVSGQRVSIGDTTVEVVFSTPRTPDAQTHGVVPFVRSPRVEERFGGEEFVAPEIPGEVEPQPFPWLAMVAPIIMGGVMFAVTRSPLSIAFVLLSPVLMVSNFLSGRANRRRKHRESVDKFTARLEKLDSSLEASLVEERRVRLKEYPSTSEVLESVRDRGPRLWTRRPEHWSFLSVRFGLATQRSRSSVKVTGEEQGLVEYIDRLNEVVARHANVPDVPVVENITNSGAIGIVGERARAAAIARGLLVQYTGLHSPSELIVAAIVGEHWSPEFEWLKWLPHTSPASSPLGAAHLANNTISGIAVLAQLEEIVTQRAGLLEDAVKRGAASEEDAAVGRGQTVAQAASSLEPIATPIPAIIVLMSDDAPVDMARLIQLTEAAPDAGIFPIWLSSTVETLPAAARTYLVGDAAERGRVGFVRLGAELGDVLLEPVDRESANSYAKSLAPVVDAAAADVDVSDLPTSVPMVNLLGADVVRSAELLIDRWRQNDSIHDRSGSAMRPRKAGRLRALVGQAGPDAMHLDLRTQGPHALVGGTTGSGKSEFLQAWVLGMAAEYSPDRVTFLFVDYKGGSAFADCVRLPHSVGLVTDLNQYLVRRALTSLRAELHYRERLLNAKRAKDLIELEKRGDPDCPPALVIVIDEFAALVGEVPEFVDGVVDIAQRGRSLGIHLIMATQRPAGVIRDNLRANTNLRIALRMADESDSFDVVGDKVAGSFDPTIPGRAVAKTGPGRLTTFQSAYAGGSSLDAALPTAVLVAELRFGSEVIWDDPTAITDEQVLAEGPTDQSVIVNSLVGAAKGAQVPVPRRPWLDELAPLFDLSRLPQRTDSDLVLGVADLPAAQQQNVITFQPDRDGSLAIYGTGGSGKTVALRTIAAAAGITPRGGPVDVYGLDFAGGGLKMLEALPHVGSIVAGDDSERVIRLLRSLRDIADERAERYGAVSAGSIADYRRITGSTDERRIVLLIDGFPTFRNEYEIPSARAPWYQSLQQLIAEGRSRGIHVVLTADRPGSVPSAITANITRKIVLRLADESSYVLLDLPNDVLSAASPPGRAIVDGYETQLAILGKSGLVSDQSDAIAGLAISISRTERAPAEPVRGLPRELRLADLEPLKPGEFAIGLADDDLAPLITDPRGVMMVAGPPGSGRTTGLAALTQILRRTMPESHFHFFGSARSPVFNAIEWTDVATTVDDISARAATLAGELNATGAHHVVVIESIADLLSTPADGPVVEVIKAVKRSENLLIAESETSTWGSSWPLLGEVKSARRGILLQPENLEGETLLKTAIPRGSRSEYPPGRGYYVASGRAQRVQLPLPDEWDGDGDASPSTRRGRRS